MIYFVANCNRHEFVVFLFDAFWILITSLVEFNASSHIQAGQVYGVPLSGTLLTKAGIFPDQRPCGEDFRRKWIEACLFTIQIS